MMSATPDREPHELPSVDRKWFPTDWLDEINPPPLPSPDAFIHRVAGGFALRLPPEDEESDSEFYYLALEQGQIVDFSYVDHYGDVHLMITGPAGHETDRLVPPAAEQFYERGTGTLVTSFDEMVEELRAAEAERSEEQGKGQPWRVSCYTWEDGQFFRFEVDADGARLVRCEGRS